MTCRRAHALLSPFLDGELSESRSEALRCHLRDCPTCSRTFRSLESLSGLYRSIAERSLPEWSAKVDTATIKSARPPRRTVRFIAAAAALLALLAFTFAPSGIFARYLPSTTMEATLFVGKGVPKFTVETRSGPVDALRTLITESGGRVLEWFSHEAPAKESVLVVAMGREDRERFRSLLDRAAASRVEVPESRYFRIIVPGRTAP